MKTTKLLPILLLGATSASLLGCSPGTPRLQVGLDYSESTQTILVEVNRKLKAGETLHAQLRWGQPGELNCAQMVEALPEIQESDEAMRAYAGPVVDDSVFGTIFNDDWIAESPSVETIAAMERGLPYIDVCLVGKEGVVFQREFDPNSALDKTMGNGRADDPSEVEIRSVEAYAEACIDEMGEIPFFEKIGENDYEPYNCLDATPIPTTVTHEDGRIDLPSEKVNQCDMGQYIYSLCEPNAERDVTNGPRVTSASNEEGTHWVMLCRKSQEEEGHYRDIAMIGNNPYTGKTCYFQGLGNLDGNAIPHPGDTSDSVASPVTTNKIWSGLHGGMGSGIQCARCHDADAYIHTPWIDQALDSEGKQIVPRMGEDDDYALGFNDMPYSIVDLEGQGWTMPKTLVSEEAAACTRCHRMGDKRWTTDWIDRLVGEDSAWNNLTTEEYLKFEHKFWMPPGVEGLDEATWADSPEGKAVAFIQNCGKNPDQCEWAELPTEPITEIGELPPIELEGAELALEAAKVLGADALADECPNGDCSTRRCAECHSVSKPALKRWQKLTEDAWKDCDLERKPADMTQEEAMASIDCLRVEPSIKDSVFATEKLGVLSTGVQYGPFQNLFQKAYGTDKWLKPYLQFKARVGMPKGGHPKLSQREYAVLEKWFDEGLPNIAQTIIEPPAPTVCEATNADASIASHISNMAFDGWAAVNAEAGLNMFGCTDSNPENCLANFEDRASEWGNGPGKHRQLREMGFRTSFWTRSSPDGRYVGNGGCSMGDGCNESGAMRSTITDLLDGVDIPVKASYDPGFFPDGSGFMYQGSVGGAGLCSTGALEKHNAITFEEAECTKASGINLYQHLATATGGNDYFIINSQFTSDPGNGRSDPVANFGASAEMKFTPMVFDGNNYEPSSPIFVDSAFEGDSVLSPSAQLVVSRLTGPNGNSLGYVVRRVKMERTTTGFAIDVGEKLATICDMQGAKAAFSFDERFLVTHHYESDGTANLFLYDLSTSEVKQITDVPAGQRALFPHFRSDGWIYYTIKDGEKEFAVASDAAIVSVK